MKSSDTGGYRSRLFKLVLDAGQKVTFTGSQSDGPSTVSNATFPKSHEGHSGWTIEPGFSSYGAGGISSLIPNPAFNTTPHIVLLMIGTNDVYASTGQSTMSNRLEALLDEITQTLPSALVVLATLTPLSSTNAALEAYNAKIPTIVQNRSARGQHIVMADMSKMTTSSLSDGVHPNDQGYAYMANVWYAAIRAYLPRG
jgi:lysophospholipase L1-like esterase